jgi:hypothetical protein
MKVDFSSSWCISNPCFIEVVEDPFPAIKRKKISYIVRRDKSEHNLERLLIYYVTPKQGQIYRL